MRFLRFPLALPIFHPVTLCRSRSPDLDPFAIRRSQTTEVEIRLFLPYLRSTCARPPSVGQDRLILTCLRTTGTCARFSGDRKLQALIGLSIDMKVRRSLMCMNFSLDKRDFMSYNCCYEIINAQLAGDRRFSCGFSASSPNVLRAVCRGRTQAALDELATPHTERRE